MRTVFTAAALLIAAASISVAQPAGDPTGPGSSSGAESTVATDTLFVFQPARPLIDSSAVRTAYEDGFGIDILFSNSGFGLGGFYQRAFSQDFIGFVNLGITGSRNRDEFDQVIPDPESPSGIGYGVPDKVNRLYTFPLTLGLRYRISESLLLDNLRPYVNLGVGPTMIIAAPYQYEFFTSFGHASAHFTAGGFLGVGAELGGKRPVLGMNIRYYYIPFKSGLESIKGDPITQFGGLFLTMNVGFPR